MHRVLCFALLLLHCSGSKIKNDLRIPNVADLDTSLGSVGNIGNNAPNNLGSLGNLGNLGGLGLPLGTSGNNGNGQNTGISLGNIAGVLQTNIGSGDAGNIANIAQSSSSTSGNNGNGGEGGSNNENNDQNDSGLSIGNIAGVIQTNINVPTGNNDQNGNSRSENGDNNNSNDNNNGSGLNIGNLANIAQSNVQGGQGGIGNIAGIAQTNVNVPGLVGNSQNSGGLVNLNNILGLVGNSQNGGLVNLNDVLGLVGNSQNGGLVNLNNIPGLVGNSQNGGLVNLTEIDKLGECSCKKVSDLASLINLLNNNGQNNNGGGIVNVPNNAQNNNGGGGGIGNIANIAQSNVNLNGNNNNFNEENKFERPCQVFDIYCIRKYFAEHSICKESYGPTPDPMYRPQSTIFLSRINLTVTAVDVLYSGLNGRVEDFYINKETDRLVMAIEFRNMTFYAKDAYYRFHRRAREPIVTRDYLYFNYQSVLSTIIIPNTKDLQLEKSEVFAYTNDRLPTYSVGPNAFNSQDSTVQLARSQLVSDIPTTAQESQLTEAAFYTSTFIQYSICDFGLKIL